MRDDCNIHTEAEALRNGMQAPKCKRMRKTHLTADERSCGYHSSSREEQFEVVKLHCRMSRWRNLVVVDRLEVVIVVKKINYEDSMKKKALLQNQL